MRSEIAGFSPSRRTVRPLIWERLMRSASVRFFPVRSSSERAVLYASPAMVTLGAVSAARTAPPAPPALSEAPPFPAGPLPAPPSAAAPPCAPAPSAPARGAGPPPGSPPLSPNRLPAANSRMTAAMPPRIRGRGRRLFLVFPASRPGRRASSEADAPAFPAKSAAAWPPGSPAAAWLPGSPAPQASGSSATVWLSSVSRNWAAV